MEMFQERVGAWLAECFGKVIAKDKVERNHRFLEEALELVQACGCSELEALQLVDYVFRRPVGELLQETGGVMVTLAALCEVNKIYMDSAGELELRRVWRKVSEIREKQANKPKASALPIHTQAGPYSSALMEVLNERREQITKGYTAEHDAEHGSDTLIAAAACYMLEANYAAWIGGFPEEWPFSRESYKPSTKRKNLTKSIAIALAALEQIDREEANEQRHG